MKSILACIVVVLLAGCGEGVQHREPTITPINARSEMPYIVWCNGYGHLTPSRDSATLNWDSLHSGPPDSVLLSQVGLPYIFDTAYANDTAFQMLYWFEIGTSIVYHVEQIRNGAYWIKAIAFRGELQPYATVTLNDSMICIRREDSTANCFRGQSIILMAKERVITHPEFELLRKTLMKRNVLDDAVVRGTRWEGCTFEDFSRIYGKQSGKLYYRRERATRNPEMRLAIYLADSLSGLNALPRYVHEAAHPYR
jgi:hypothetical protein